MKGAPESEILESSELTIIREAVQAFDRDLDDLARARIEARIGAELDRLARIPPPLRWRSIGLPVAAALAAGIALAIVELAPQRAPIRLQPELISGFEPSAELGGALLGDGVERIEVPEGGRVRVRIAGEGELELIGPAALAVAEDDGDGVVLSLERGLVLAAVEHRLERRFRIEHPSLAVEVIGTRFLVDVRAPDRPAVAVLEGRVRILRPGSDPAILSAGEGAIDPEPEALLRALGVRLGAASGSRGVLAVTGASGMRVSLEAGPTLGSVPLWAVMSSGRVDLEASLGDRCMKARAEVPPNATGTLHVALEAAPPALPPEPEPSPKLRVEDAESFYRRAEAALAAKEVDAAAKILEQLVARFPRDPLAATALYELARIASDRGDVSSAETHLEALLERRGDPAVAESGLALRCRLRSESEEIDRAIACWTEFRERFPSSSRDRAVLRALVGLADRAGGCEVARPWLEELIRLYPYAAAEIQAEERLARCAR